MEKSLGCQNDRREEEGREEGERRMKRETSAKVKYLKEEGSVCDKQSLIALFISQLLEETVCFPSSVMLTAGVVPVHPASDPTFYLTWKERRRQNTHTDTHTHTATTS